MTTKKRLEARRQRNRQIAQADAEQRCVFCRRRLPKGCEIFLAASLQALRYCNIDCWRDQLDAQGHGV